MYYHNNPIIFIKQIVNVNSDSVMCDSTSGVPQGSTLGEVFIFVLHKWYAFSVNCMVLQYPMKT